MVRDRMGCLTGFSKFILFVLGCSALGAMILIRVRRDDWSWLNDVVDKDVTVSWATIGTVFGSGIAVFIISILLRLFPILQVLTWTPMPIALVAALWMVEGVPVAQMLLMLEAAFAASIIGVVFDTTLILLLPRLKFQSRRLNGILLWCIVLSCTIGAGIGAVYASNYIVVAFSLGVFASALNILNIPRENTVSIEKCCTVNSCKCCSCRIFCQAVQEHIIAIPFVWILLTVSVILQEFKEYRAAGIISNAPCLHFMVAFMLWTTTEKANDLTESVISMVDNIGIGSVAVFSSSVFTGIFWQGLSTETSFTQWQIFWVAIGVSLSVSLIMFLRVCVNKGGDTIEATATKFTRAPVREPRYTQPLLL